MDKEIKEIKLYSDGKLRLPNIIRLKVNVSSGDKLVVFNYGDLIILSNKEALKNFIGQNEYVMKMLFEQNNIKVCDELIHELLNDYIQNKPKSKFWKKIKEDIKETEKILYWPINPPETP